MCCQVVNRHRIVSSVIGSLTIIISFVLYFVSDKVIDQQIRSKVVLREDSYGYDIWKNVPAQIYYDVYIFNLTNGPDVLNSGAKPDFEEIGPFVFREQRHKENITFETNGTVSYRQRKVYHYITDKSIGVSLSASIVHLNYAIIGASSVIRNQYSPSDQLIWDGMLNNICETNPLADCSLFQIHNVSELLFDGYYDPFLDGAQILFPSPGNRFAYFLSRNDSFDGFYNVFTGDKGLDKLGLMDMWRFKKNIGQFRPDSTCDTFNYSSAGDLRPPFEMTTNSDPVYMFVGDLCRSFKLVYKEDIKVSDVKCKRYAADEHLYDYDIDENKCFCQSDNSCPVSGVANLSSCAWNAPVFISFPHFLHGDHQYRDNVKGMRPDKGIHQFYVDYEPTLGVPIRGNAVIQINILVERDLNFHALSKLKQEKVFWPQIWFKLNMELDSDPLSKIKLIVKVVPIVIAIVSLLLLITGSLILVSVIYYKYFTNNKIYK